MTPVPSDWLVPLAIVVLWVALHGSASRGHRGRLPDRVRQRFGTSTGTTVSRWWAHWTAVFFHNSWGHLAYNALVVLATWPFAVVALGPVPTATVAVLAGPLAWALVHVGLLVLVVRRADDDAWTAHRAVGGSLVAFAGAGVALAAAPWSAWVMAAVVGAYVAYEGMLVVAGFTGGLVPVYHVVSLGLGLAGGLALVTWG